jgi:hypothetical protein
MINLTDTKFGQKRRLVIGGINSWNHVESKSLNVVFYIQMIDDQGELIEDKSIVQNRRVVYSVNNQNFVNAQFDRVDEGTQGARAEYDYFFQLCGTTPIITLITQLSEKLIERGIFD